MSDFFPENYEGIPQAPSNYLKLEEGQNIFRILGSAIVGWEYWIQDKENNRKPVRVKSKDEVPAEYFGNKDNRNNAKYFWAFPVYNFETNSIQVFEVKQKTIMNALEALVKSKSWGDPKEYNITITKTKTGAEPRDVEFSVMPEPKSAVTKDILEAYNKVDLKIELLYEGKDPFGKDGEAESESVDIDEVPEDLGK